MNALQIVLFNNQMINLICKQHNTVVRLSSDDATNALGSMPERVKSQEVAVFDLALVSQVLQSGE